MAPFLPSVIRAALIAWVVLHGVAAAMGGMAGSTGIEIDPRALRNVIWITGVAGLVALVEIRRQRPQVLLGNLGIPWTRLWGVSLGAVLAAEGALQVALVMLRRG